MRTVMILLGLALAAAAAQAEEWMSKRQVAAGFADTREAIVLAIENRGLVVNYTSHIGAMLARTGADLGAARQIFDQAEIIEFCSAGLSRQMMEADPHNIVLCPFAIAIYTLPGAPDATWVAYRQARGPAAALVTPLLQAIADEAGP